MAKPYLDELILAAKKLGNIYTDISGLIDIDHKIKEMHECIEEAARFLGEAGPKKLLFGTDYPVQAHSDSVHLIEEAMRGFNPLDKNDVYYNNAHQILYP
jgi:predicted TIM-barrel fold metal-dependent hydrolase